MEQQVQQPAVKSFERYNCCSQERDSSRTKQVRKNKVRDIAICGLVYEFYVSFQLSNYLSPSSILLHLASRFHWKSENRRATVFKMGSAPQIYTKLKDSLSGSGAEVLLPDSPGYAESIKRWSEHCEKRAVSPSHDLAQSQSSYLP